MTFAASRLRIPRALVAAVAALALTAGVVPAVQALGRLVPVIVMSNDSGAAAKATQSVGGVVDNALPIVNGVSARVPSSRIAELSHRTTVTPDRAMHLQSASYGDNLSAAYPAAIGANKLWRRGATGDGVTVALIDTGIADVRDLAGRVVAEANFSPERTAKDTFGHGTFQAGLIAGNGASSRGAYTGVAPDANILSVKVAGADGSTSLGRVLAAIQLVDYSADRFDVRVALLALSSGSPFPPGIDPLSLALRSLWAHGVVVVVPAGNDGPDPGTIGSPGEDPVLLTAGSLNDQTTSATGDDTVSDFSSRGPTRWGDSKPDVAAPGEHLVSLRAPGSTVDRENPNSRVGDSYFKGSGTSMSSAVTAGAAALLLSARPGLEPDEVKAMFEATAGDVTGGNAASAGAGELNVYAASRSRTPNDLPEAPEVGDTPAPWSPPGARVEWRRGDDGIYRWVHRRWDARSWDGRSWDGRSWDARSWDSRTWDSRSWDARSWDSRTWDARSWAARQWAARSWAARSWAARQWTGRSWDSRSWDSRSWDSRSWDGRTWTSRSWDGRSWVSRSWDSRSWASDGWDDWDARSWSSRSWASQSFD
jgi:serine protease AprX